MHSVDYLRTFHCKNCKNRLDIYLSYVELKRAQMSNIDVIYTLPYRGYVKKDGREIYETLAFRLIKKDFCVIIKVSDVYCPGWSLN